MTGRLVRLPDEPFRLGELDPAAVLRPLVSGLVIVDNDVNWAARAERDAAGRGHDADFAYLFLGEGLGAAVVSNGDVVRGHACLAREVAHIIVPGPGAARFIDVFGALGLRQPGTSAIDVPRLLAMTASPGSGAAVRETIAHAVSGVLAALTALADPEFVVVGGPWGTQPTILDAITARAAACPARSPSGPPQWPASRRWPAPRRCPQPPALSHPGRLQGAHQDHGRCGTPCPALRGCGGPGRG